MPPGFGINLVASISGNIGLGVTARNMAEAWDRRWIDQLIGLWRAQSLLSPVPGKFSAMTALRSQPS